MAHQPLGLNPEGCSGGGAHSPGPVCSRPSHCSSAEQLLSPGSPGSSFRGQSLSSLAFWPDPSLILDQAGVCGASRLPVGLRSTLLEAGPSGPTHARQPHPPASGDPLAEGTGLCTKKKGCHGGPHAGDCTQVGGWYSLGVEHWHQDPGSKFWLRALLAGDLQPMI